MSKFFSYVLMSTASLAIQFPANAQPIPEQYIAEALNNNLGLQEKK